MEVHLMSDLDELLAQIPMDQLASQLGVSEEEAATAAKAAIPALLGGMGANAADPNGLASLEKAVSQHDGSLLEGGVDLSQVDTTDGGKIVGHVFGDNQEAVVNQLGGLGGVGGASTITKLLPLLAPLVMSFLGKKMLGGGSSDSGSRSGGGIGDLLGGLLGGGGSGGGGGFGDLLGSLGGLLGGGSK
jgi:hypothetical protein